MPPPPTRRSATSGRRPAPSTRLRATNPICAATPTGFSPKRRGGPSPPGTIRRRGRGRPRMRWAFRATSAGRSSAISRSSTSTRAASTGCSGRARAARLPPGSDATASNPRAMSPASRWRRWRQRPRPARRSWRPRPPGGRRSRNGRTGFTGSRPARPGTSRACAPISSAIPTGFSRNWRRSG